MAKKQKKLVLFGFVNCQISKKRFSFNNSDSIYYVPKGSPKYTKDVFLKDFFKYFFIDRFS